jgi:hypothetical protein
MNTKFKIVIVVWIAIAMTSCYDVLDQIPTDRYSDVVVWNDPKLLEQHLAELYLCVPVMINDAPGTKIEWGWGSQMNVDNPSSDPNDEQYGYGFSAQFQGPLRTLEVADEARCSNAPSTQNMVTLKLDGILANNTKWQWWGNAYYTIRMLNHFIQYAGSSSIYKIEERIAEARFLRAFCYFAMVKRYGGVPLITEVLELSDYSEKSMALYPKRNTEKEVYDFILQETDEISKILPSSNEAGRANKWAALALRSRAALYAGSIAQFGTQQLNGLLGFPSGTHTGYYQMCYDACTEIMTQSPHRLYNVDADKVQNYKNIFLNKGNCEAIMVKQHSGNSGYGNSRWSWDMVECPRNVWGTANNHCPYVEMVEEFELKDGSSGVINKEYAQSRLWSLEELWGDRDPRFFASIWTQGTSWPDPLVGGVSGVNTVDMHYGIITEDGTLLDLAADSYNGIPARGPLMRSVNTGFGVMKYLDPTANNYNWYLESTTDYLIFRFGEILLNYAEAAFELGKSADALDAVNQIRGRAGIALLASIDSEKIRHERKVELAFENHRYWDLRRWRIAVEKLTRTYTGLRYIYDFASGKYRVVFIDNIDGSTTTPKFYESNYYFPIGQNRIAINSNLVENPGY